MTSSLTDGIHFKDSRVRDILITSFNEMVGYRDVPSNTWCAKGRIFLLRFKSYSLEELDWKLIRDVYHEQKYYKSNLSKLFILLLINLYRNNCLPISESIEVERLYDGLIELIRNAKKRVAPIFEAEDLSKLHFCQNCDGYFTICHINAEREIIPFIITMISDNDCNERGYKCNFFSQFNQSLLPYRCQTIDDFNGTTFWTQVIYYKEKYASEKDLKGYLFWIMHFYRKLAKSFNQHNLYDSHLSRTLLFNYRITPFITKLDSININDIFLAPSYYTNTLVPVLFLKFKNSTIKESIRDFISSRPNFGSHLNLTIIIESFEDSLGKGVMAIQEPKDFNEESFFTQVSYYLSNNKHLRRGCISFLIHFYRHLIQHYIGDSFFNKSYMLNGEIFFSGSFLSYILNGYSFQKYSSMYSMEYNVKTVFVLENFDYVSSKKYDTHHLSLDLSEIESELYRRLAFDYYTSTPETLIKCPNKRLLIDILNALYRLKLAEGYPYPSFLDFYPSEANFITNKAMSLYKSRAKSDSNAISFNNQMAKITSFFNWIIEYSEAKIHKENTFLSNLSRIPAIKSNDANPIPVEELRMIMFELEKNAAFNPLYRMYLIIVIVIIHTPIRISNVFGITVSSIEESVIPGKYQINFKKTKTSGADRDTIPISNYVYQQLQVAINMANEIRSSCYSPFKEEYVFVYENAFHCCHPILISSINDYLGEICECLGLNAYNVSNFRDTHMTKALVMELENRSSLDKLHITTRHKSISTTYGYVPSQIDELMEVLYNIRIERDDNTMAYNPQDNIEEQIPDNVNSKASLVSRGCGHCKSNAKKCRQPFPCILCADFVTTPAFEPMFEYEVRRYGELIETTACEEEKQRLSFFQQVYAIYLRDIKLMKQSQHE